jgi:hypothetical protein
MSPKLLKLVLTSYALKLARYESLDSGQHAERLMAPWAGRAVGTPETSQHQFLFLLASMQ